jgi:CubicO group peptidase (beta-lactamase class C family)
MHRRPAVHDKPATRAEAGQPAPDTRLLRAVRPSRWARDLLLLVLSLTLPPLVGTNELVAQPLSNPAPTAAGSRWHGSWRIAPRNTHGFDAAKLDRVATHIGEMEGVYSFLLVCGGDLLVERYFREAGRDKPHNLKSASKSVISLLIGIAIDKGHLRLDQPIAELLPEARTMDPAKGAITVRQLLDMTSGLESTSYGGYNRWVTSDDWVHAALSLPLVAEPGTFYQYSTGNTHLLSAILTAATGMSTLAFANRHLFGPMDIRVVDWGRDPQGRYIGGNNLLLVPRDMAKIGQLLLAGGRWADQQLIPSAWIQRSTRSSGLGEHDVFGTHSNLWWTDTASKDFAAVGFGGQFIYVSPDRGCAMVVTSSLLSKGEAWSARLFQQLRRDVLGRTDVALDRLVASNEEDAPAGEIDRLRRGLDRARVELSEMVRQLGAESDAGSHFKTTARVNFRSGPSASANLLGILERSVPVDVMATQGQWFQVRVGDREGWLHADFVGPATESADLGPELAMLRRALNRDGRGVKIAAPLAASQVAKDKDSAATTEREALQSQMGLLQATLETQQAARAEITAEATRLAGALQENRQRRQGLEQTIAALRQARRSQQTRLAQAEAALAQNQAQLAAVASDKTAQEQQLAELLGRSEQLGAELAVAASGRQKMQKNQQALQDDRDAALTRIASLERSLQASQRSAGQLAQARQSERDAARAELATVRTSVAELQDALAQNEIALSAVKNELAQTALAADDAASARKAVADQLLALRSLAASQAHALKRAQADQQGIDHNLAQARQRTAQLEALLTEARRRGAAPRAALNGVQAKLQSAMQALQAAQTARGETQAELARLRQQASTQVALSAAPEKAASPQRSEIAEVKPATTLSVAKQSREQTAPPPAMAPVIPSTPPLAIATIEDAVRIWAKAWANQDVSAYLGAYADDFVPEGGKDLTNWKTLRRSRLTKPRFIEIALTDLVIEPRDGGAVARFLQAYRADTYADKTSKELALRKTVKGWRIVRERAL